MRCNCLLIFIIAVVALGCDMPRDVIGTHAFASEGKIRVGGPPSTAISANA